ncbi:MAG: hypothetical protein QM504_17205 [Pseudomonadota bacterium]
MGFKKILLQLKELLQKKTLNKKKLESIKLLLKKLKSKQQKLEIQLKKESDNEKRKDIKRSILIIRAQQRKGRQIIDEFQSK